MHLRGKTVHPDKRRGQVYLYQTDDSLMHFCWKDRSAGSVEEVRILFYFSLFIIFDIFFSDEMAK